METKFTSPDKTCLRLLNGDCLTLIPGMPNGLVDIVVTSPPYNLGIDYTKYEDTISREDYLTWIVRWAEAIKPVLKDSGSIFLNIGSKPSDPWVPYEVITHLRAVFCLQNVIHWIKSISIDKEDVGGYDGISQDVTVGHYKPINSKRYLNDCHEFVFHLTKHGTTELDRLAIGVPYQDKTNVTRWKTAGSDVHCRGNAWFVPYKTIRSRDLQRPHPACFPVELASKCMRLHGITPETVCMDPFLGIGHSGIAAAQLGINFIGIELDPEYYAVACSAIGDSLSRTAFQVEDEFERSDPDEGAQQQLTLF